jgi:hypothetical protein
MSELLLEEKWSPVLDAERVDPIENAYKRKVTAQLLENQERSLMETASSVESNISTWDPVLISLVRRMAPKLIAYDIIGVQPLTMPTGIIFALRSRYTDKNGAEALFNEANSAFSGTGTQSSADTTWATVTYGSGIATATAENATNIPSMSLTIEKVTVTAKTRQLRADYSLELAQDLKAVHGLDADNELVSILSQEITSELNREVIRTIYTVAKPGAQWSEITAAGTFNISTDSDGRYFAEKVKGLYFAIQRDANAIALETRAGKGNFVIMSADVASALSSAGLMSNSQMFDSVAKLDVDPAGMTYAGMLGDMKVYVDPYLTFNAYVVGFRGPNAYSQGLFFCPYVPLQLFRATDPVTFQPALAFKTRYGMVANPMVGNMTANQNPYFRKVLILNLLT